jgi:hypothetical protein
VNVRFFPLRLHAAVDYLVPLTLAGAPLLFEFPKYARWVAFAVAGIHLSMTLLTDYPGGWIKLIPFRIHLVVELILGPCLVAMPWLLHFSSHPLSTVLCTGWGVISFVSYFVTIRTVPPR